MQDWPDSSSHIVIAIESLELEQSFQQDGAMHNIFVMYNFLPQFCQSAQDQCTQALPNGSGSIQYNHVVVSPSPVDASFYLYVNSALYCNMLCAVLMLHS